MTARFSLVRATDSAERIIARTLGGVEKAFRAPPLEPLEDRQGAGFVGVAHCAECHLFLAAGEGCLHIAPVAGSSLSHPAGE